MTKTSENVFEIAIEWEKWRDHNHFLYFSAAYVLLTTLVLADLFGAEKFTNSFGLLLLFQGVATFGGPPIVGKIRGIYSDLKRKFDIDLPKLDELLTLTWCTLF